MKKLVVSLLVLSMLSFFVIAQPSCSSFNINNTMQLFLAIPLFNSQIPSCNITLPEQLGILNNKNIVATINMNSGQSQGFYVSFTDNKLSGLNTGIPQEYSYEILLSESTLDSILQSENILDSLLTNYNSGNIVVNPHGVWSSVVWFFASWFI